MAAARQRWPVWPLLAALLTVLQAEALAAPFEDRRDGIVLQRVPAPDTDTIRWVTSARSVERAAGLGSGGRLVRLDRFGRKVEIELHAALVGAQAVILDLRRNRGGSLTRMLRVAGRFTGPVAAALRQVRGGEVRGMSIPAPQGAPWRGPVTVLVGADTASSGEVLAALLRRFAGATVLGERTFGKDYVLRIEPIGQGWRALVPDGRLLVPGEILAGGLLPDGPIPADLAASLAAD
jgi:carboxyl-terminal processing protease